MRTTAPACSIEAESGRPRDNGFTRIELLAVVLTIAMMGLLILPGFARSGDDGARIICINNMHQLGTASLMYAADNRDYIAFPNWGTTYPDMGWLYTPSNPSVPNQSRIPNPDLFPWKADPESAWETGLWFQYVRNPKTYLCPADIQSRTYTTLSAAGGRQNKLSSYLMNGAPCGFNFDYRTCKISDVWNPKCYLLWNPDENALGPGNPGAFAFNDGSSFPNSSDGPPDHLHSPYGSEIASVDGTVQYVTTQKWQSESTGTGTGPGGKSLAWWSPFGSSGH